MLFVASGIGGQERLIMSFRVLPAFSALALGVSAAFAQGAISDPSQNQLTRLDPVVVTASRFEDSLSDVPAFAQVISRKDISDAGVTSVPEAIGTLGNINVRSLAGGPLGILADVDMRGFGASARDNTLILVDGMRVSPIDSGSIRWESIPLGMVDRIEIIHGGGSVQYGDKAVGGVINIITRADLNAPSSVALRAGSYGSALGSASLVSGLGPLRGRVDVSSETTDGWRENSQAQQGAVRGLLSYRLGGTDQIFLEGSYSSQRYFFPGGVVGEVNTGDRRAAKFNNLDERTVTNGSRGLIGISQSFGRDWKFLAELSYSESSATQDRPYYARDANQSTPGQMRFSKWSYDITPRVKKIWNTAHDSVIGFDYQKARATYLPDTAEAQNATLENTSYYFTHRYLITPRADVSGGIRRQYQNAASYDRSTDFFGSGATSVTNANKEQAANAADLAFTYRYGEGQADRVFVRSNRSYRFANTDEYWGCTYDAAWNCVRVFKGILRPQKADTFELGGSRSLFAAASLSGTIFQLDTKDEIRYRYADNENINAPKIRRQGASFRLQYPVTRAVLLSSGLTLQRAEYREGAYQSKEVPLAPETIGFLGLSLHMARQTVVRVNLTHVGSQRYMDDDENTKNQMPSYTLLDLGARYRGGAWEWDFRIQNLLNSKYSSYGGYGFITTSTGSRNSYFYYPGDPQTWWLTARYRFE
jgi:iron complex outermembrane receptor protein